MESPEGGKTRDAIGPLRRRLVYVPLLAGMLLLLTTNIRVPPRRAPLDAAVATLEIHALDRREAPPGGRVGALVMRRGWELRSDEPRFGGISAMRIEGDAIVAISDAGSVLRFPVPRRAGTSRVAAVSLNRQVGASKTSLDAESLVRHEGRSWLAFEGINAVVRYGPDGRAHAANRPMPLRDWGGNSGPEAMVRLRDGSFLVFSEGRSDRRFSPVVLFVGDPVDRSTVHAVLRYKRPRGYRVTDAALLPDGRVLVLHRRVDLFAGMSALLSIVEVDRLRPNVTLIGRIVAELRSPWAVDNMEALSVTGESGQTIVRIASDDNFMALQRTLLLEFRLDEAATR